MNDISNTALVTLKCHVQDAGKEDAVLDDTSSLKALAYLDTVLDHQGKKILHSRMKKNLIKHTVTRARKYDEYTRQFLREHPEAAIINIGCGLDHRFERIDNGRCVFFDIDLPDIMDLKKNIFAAGGRYRPIGQSVFDFTWIDKIDSTPVLLLAEGVFMYCHERDIRALLHELHQRMPGSDIVFEVFNSKWLKGWRRILVDFKLQKQLKFGKEAAFQFGITDSEDIECWSEHYKLIEDWSYVDVVRPNASDALRKIQWTVYYKIS